MYFAELNVPQNHVYLFKPHTVISSCMRQQKLSDFWYNLNVSEGVAARLLPPSAFDL